MRRSRYPDECFVETQIVSDGILRVSKRYFPAIASGFEVREIVKYIDIDSIERDLLTG